MKRVSVTQMETWQHCQVKYDNVYVKHLRAQRPAGRALTQGKAFASTLEQALMLGDTDKKREYAMSATVDMPKLKAMFASLPDEVWDISIPVAEDKLEVGYEYHYDGTDEGAWFSSKNPEAMLMIVGKPDIWTTFKDGVLVLEFKTCSDSVPKAKDKLRAYEMWAPQATRYAVLLHDAYPHLQGEPFYRQHILVSSSGKGFTLMGEIVPVNPVSLERERQEMCGLAASVGTVGPFHSPGPLCNWCDWKDRCIAEYAGWSVE